MASKINKELAHQWINKMCTFANILGFDILNARSAKVVDSLAELLDKVSGNKTRCELCLFEDGHANKCAMADVERNKELGARPRKPARRG